MSGGTILVVDDERTLARAIRGYLVEAGYEVEVASRCLTACARMWSSPMCACRA